MAGDPDLGRAYALMGKALDKDEAGQVEQALKFYTEAVDVCIKAKEKTNDAKLKEKLVNLAKQALDRGEVILGPIITDKLRFHCIVWPLKKSKSMK